MVAEPWLAAEVRADERALWSQGPAPGAVWGVIGPLVGAGFALFYGGSQLADLPGPWSWLLEPLALEERLGIPGWLVLAAGAFGFVSLVAKDAAVESLSGWVVTDRRLVRVVRFMPWRRREWPLGAVEVRKIRLKKVGAVVKLRVPGRWGKESFSIRARASAAALAEALGRGRAERSGEPVAEPVSA